MLSSKVYSITNNKAGYTRQRGWDPLQERELILAHLNKYSKITREDVVELGAMQMHTKPRFPASRTVDK